MDELEPGTILQGRYCVERLIAQGGMSRLYQGHPLHGAGRVAIKQLDLSGQGMVTREDLAQFEKEYEILHTLEHPGLARALDFLAEDGCHYLVEEFVPGKTLEAHIQGAGRLSCDEAVLIMEQVLQVLDHLHGHGVIYRDLKPQNVILQPRPCGEDDESSTPLLPFTVRLVDFGAARRWRKGATRDTIPLGTPGFAPPEQYGTAQSDARSDVYSAGVLLHYMLTGHPPDPTRGWVFEAPHHLVSGIPRDLGGAVLQAVQVDPNRRFQGAHAMGQALKRAVGRPDRCPACGWDLPEDNKPCSRCLARTRRLPVVEIVGALAIAVVLAMLVAPNFVRVRNPGQVTACKSNLKNIGTALEMYSTDNSGRFPARLSKLTPEYLKVIPTCPSVGSDTYLHGYVSVSAPDGYTVVCCGVNHNGVGQGENYPQYTSREGLISQ